MGSVQRRGRLSREEILSAAATSFYQLGYAETTLGHVARQLAVTDKAIYYYFRSKDALFLETLNSSASRLAAVIGSIAASRQSGLGKVKSFTRTILQESADLRLNLNCLPNHLEATEAGKRLRALERANDETVIGWISDGIEDGSIRPGNPPTLWRWTQGALIWMDVWSRREHWRGSRRLEQDVLEMVDRSLAGDSEARH